MPLEELINNFPIKLKEPPIKNSILHLPRFLITKANPSKADLQKL